MLNTKTANTISLLKSRIKTELFSVAQSS